MDVAEFRRVLAAGLGRAILYLRDHDDTPYRDVIFYACTHAMVFDRDTEGSRAEFLFELIQQTDNPEWYRDGILAALAAPSEKGEYYDRQLFEFARLFAEKGDSTSHQALYTAFARNADDPNNHRLDQVGADDLIQLDGLAAFEFILRHLDMRQLTDEESSVPQYLLWELGNKIGEHEAALALERLAEQDEKAAVFHTALLRDRAASEQYSRRAEEPLTYARIKALIADPNGGRKLSVLQRWGKNASDGDLEQAAQDLLNEDDPERLCGYVLVFGKRPFPLAPDKLIRLASGIPDERFDFFEADIRTKTALWAWNALEHIRHPLVRAFALDSLSLIHWADRAVGALKHNYQEGDHIPIQECLLRQQSEWYFHDVGLSALQVFETNPTPESVDILHAIYERGPCSMCRNRCVERLIALNQLPDWMAEECRFDAREFTRADVAKFREGRDESAPVNP